MHTFIKRSVATSIKDLAPLYKGWHAFRRCWASLATSSRSSVTSPSSLFHVSSSTLKSPCAAMLSGTIDSSSMISHTSCTMPSPPTPSSLEFRFKVASYIPTCSTFSLGNKSSRSCPTWTPSSTSCIGVYVEILLAATHSSSESSRGHGPFQTLNSGCLPFNIKCPRTVASKTDLTFPTHLLHGHLILVMPWCWAHSTLLAHILSSIPVNRRGSSNLLLLHWPLGIF
jgi:hypothetical protein